MLRLTHHGVLVLQIFIPAPAFTRRLSRFTARLQAMLLWRVAGFGRIDGTATEYNDFIYTACAGGGCCPYATYYLNGNSPTTYNVQYIQEHTVSCS